VYESEIQLDHNAKICLELTATHILIFSSSLSLPSLRARKKRNKKCNNVKEKEIEHKVSACERERKKLRNL
jgi:hypothetical protein